MVGMMERGFRDMRIEMAGGLLGTEWAVRSACDAQLFRPYITMIPCVEDSICQLCALECHKYHFDRQP